jgi:hypothetical protein
MAATPAPDRHPACGERRRRAPSGQQEEDRPDKGGRLGIWPPAEERPEQTICRPRPGWPTCGRVFLPMVGNRIDAMTPWHEVFCRHPAGNIKQNAIDGLFPAAKSSSRPNSDELWINTLQRRSVSDSGWTASLVELTGRGRSGNVNRNEWLAFLPVPGSESRTEIKSSWRQTNGYPGTDVQSQWH